MTFVKVYRSGLPHPPAQRGCEADAYAAADAVRPAGRQGRTDAVFASPTLTGVTRWVRGNAMVNAPDYKVRELVVDSDSVWVYEVRAWERVGGFDPNAAEKYWATGMTLTDWLSRADLDGREWEVLIGEDAVRSVRPVSAKRVIEAGRDEYDRDELRRVLR